MAGIAAAALAVTTFAGASPASAETVHGTNLPNSSLQYSFVGCDNLRSRTSETLAPMIGFGSDDPETGERSLAYDLAGGNAVGLLAKVSDLRSPGAISLRVSSEAGATGVSYAVTQSRSMRGTERVWVGRADLPAAGEWRTVSAGSRTYTWRQFDLGRMKYVVKAGMRTGTLAGFARRVDARAAQVTLGYGCNGAEFNIDDFRGAGASYDIDGLKSTVGIKQVTADDGTPQVTGSVNVAGATIEGAELTLKSRKGTGPWTEVGSVPAGKAVTATPGTTYRFELVDNGLALDSRSRPLQVTAEPVDPEPTPTPTPSPTPTPTPTPTPSPTPEAPETSPADPETTPAEPESTQPPTGETSGAPEASATAEPDDQETCEDEDSKADASALLSAEPTVEETASSEDAATEPSADETSEDTCTEPEPEPEAEADATPDADTEATD